MYELIQTLSFAVLAVVVVLAFIFCVFAVFIATWSMWGWYTILIIAGLAVGISFLVTLQY